MTGTRRRFLVAVLLAAVFPAAAWGQPPAPPASSRDEPDVRESALPKSSDTLSIQGAFLGGAQWIAASNATRKGVFGAASLDVGALLRASKSTRVFLDLQGLAGQGPDQRLGTLSRLNNDADRLEGRDERLIVRELSLRLSWLDDRVRLSVGKIDVNHYFDRNLFAEDETTQFLSTAFVSVPVLAAPPNAPGAALRVTTGDWRYAFGVYAPEDVDGDLSGVPFIIGEVGYRNIFALQGHYRLWARVRSEQQDRDRVTWASTSSSLPQWACSSEGA